MSINTSASDDFNKKSCNGSLTDAFFNVIVPNGEDPWVYKHTDGTYYLSRSTDGHISLWKSPYLTTLHAGVSKTVWKPPQKGSASKHIWAPEIHFINNKWYIYFAATDGLNERHRMYVLENNNSDPFEGQFVLKGKIYDPADDRWAIDGTIFENQKKLYFVWSGWEGNQDIRQILYIAPMENPWTLSGHRIEISRPSYDWEKSGHPHVNEGPQILCHNDFIYIIYSANRSWTDFYCLGLLSARARSNLLEPSSWKKNLQPVFRSDNGLFAPGHASFVKSPDKKEDWIVYHTARFQGAGWTRNIRIQPYSWLPSGMPFFGSPMHPNTLIKIPGGEPVRRRYEAETAQLGGLAKVARHMNASGGAKVGQIDNAESFIKFVVNVEATGTYIIGVRFGNGTGRRSTHHITINGNDPTVVNYPNGMWDNWSNTCLPVDLNAGTNTIRFNKGEGLAEIDCIDVVMVDAG